MLHQTFKTKLRWCLTCLSGGFLRIKFRFFSELVNESSFSENENLGISFERFLPIFQNPHACTGGQSQQTIAPVSFQNYTRSSNPSSQKTESLFQKNWKEIEFPFNLKSSKLAARTSTIISKKKKLNKGLSNDISGSENHHSEQKKITKTYKKQLYQ